MNQAKTKPKTTTFEALLGVLSMGPMTGYEIRQRIDSSIGNFWSESFGQIYPTLAKLHKQGLVEAKSDKKTVGKLYSLTPAGRKRLRAWLAEMPQPRTPRNELLLKLFFATNGDLARAHEQVLDQRARSVADLRRYEAIEAHLKAEQSGNPGLPFFLITLNYGLAEARAILAWADQTVAMLDQLQRTNPVFTEAT